MSRFNPCLLIPVYNHGSLIQATFERLRQYHLPCIMVDDGSEPATAAVLDALAEREPSVTLLRLEKNSGKGAAVIRGIAEANQRGYTHALQIDADGQHNTHDIPAMLALARKNPSALVSGAPQYGDDIPRSRLYGRYITHFWVWVETLSFDIVDSMCGFRIYPVASTHALAQRIAIGQRMTFDIDIMVRLYWEGVRVLFLPTHVSYPENGISHFRGLRDNVQISWLHTRLVCSMLLRFPRLLRNRKARSGSDSGKHWSEKNERGSQWGMRFCLWCYRKLGKRALHSLLYLIIGWFFLFASSARRESQRYLARVLQRPPTHADSFHHFMQFGRAIVDKLTAWNGDVRHTDVLFHQRQLLLDQKATGKGCVILTAHLGNSDICRALSGYVEGLHINVLMFTHHAEQINRLLTEVNPQASLEIIQADNIGPDTAMLLHEKVQRGEFVIIAADRTSPTSMHRVSRASFLGHPAPFPQGPFILASLLECPVYLMFAPHNGQQYEIFVEQFADQLAFPRRQRDALLADAAQRYANRLEHYCRRSPLQWFNFYNFWHDDD